MIVSRDEITEVAEKSPLPPREARCEYNPQTLMMMLAALWLLQADAPALDNEYVRVWRNAAPCASATNPECGDRIIVALGDVALWYGGAFHRMTRGDVAVFKPAESYEAPHGDFFEVAIKANHPPVESPRERIAPDKNTMRYDGEHFFIFEERLEPGDTRPRHSHSQRVVMQLNATRLQQWPDNAPPLILDVIPDRVAFNPAVIHIVKNVGNAPLRGIIIEFKPEISR